MKDAVYGQRFAVSSPMLINNEGMPSAGGGATANNDSQHHQILKWTVWDAQVHLRYLAYFYKVYTITPP